MKLLEDVILTNTIDIKTSPRKIYEFFLNLEEETYRKWVPEDHVNFRWIKGDPWQKGSVVYAEEYIHGKLHKLKFRIQEVVNEKRIEYTPAFLLLRLWFPKNTFRIEEIDEGSRFTATVNLRIGRMAKRFAKNRIKEGLAAVKRHMQEEGEDLKKMLEQP